MEREMKNLCVQITISQKKREKKALAGVKTAFCSEDEEDRTG